MPAPISLPGTVSISGPEATLEWVRPAGGVLGELSLRLGSDPRAEELLVAVMRSLRTRVPHDTWEGIADELPFSTRAILRNDVAVAPWPGGDLVETVGRAMLIPHARSELAVRAVFGALRRALPRGLCDAVGEELPPELRELWSRAR